MKTHFINKLASLSLHVENGRIVCNHGLGCCRSHHLTYETIQQWYETHVTGCTERCPVYAEDTRA